MRVGDFMILNRPDEVGQAEVRVISPTGTGMVMVLCACGCEVTVPKEELRPVPRVYLDSSGRVALRVVEDK